MAGETSLTTLLRSMTPVLNEGAYVFCSLTDATQLQGVQPLGSFQEREGLTVIVQRQQAEQLQLEIDYVAAWLTLNVHSALAAVGLTAAVAGALAGAGISCNVIAGYYHDHLFVAHADGPRALGVLQQLANGAE
ncbi:ACT domain-containing protein [Pseudomonas spirodelae]|uniref:ACT domain-containing protein n=1 Tax=Pseudomonas spirodelae TaxID=3101751 RepID=A0ABU5PCY3_9PSED|nr:ACT domain-containing protein [Pseudomonas sp. T5W1]MBU0806900.1 ACT domain-containing protein [Gammaproteobacteria bacterium]MBU0885337.1 ACT domain-containing protein [Gammaproteobacteria bacterium]MBU1859267.1 ACT domain-containing protein [Gammaproteobacteria bacterium]MEA1607564.1 ACT domain-containing protein [Pseudomonas sp. T5W1]